MDNNSSKLEKLEINISEKIYFKPVILNVIMDELGEIGNNKPISKILTNKWLLSVFFIFLLELLIVYNQNWDSISLFLYPLFSIVGLFFFLIYNDLQHYQMNIN